MKTCLNYQINIILIIKAKINIITNNTNIINSDLTINKNNNSNSNINIIKCNNNSALSINITINYWSFS